MSRQRPDAFERDNGGPLFAPRLREMAHTSDPHTSLKAAAAMIAGDGLGAAQARALRLIEEHPGSTTKELATVGLRFPENHEEARQRIGRRVSELLCAGLIHRRGERDGCALLWPGPAPEVPS